MTEDFIVDLKDYIRVERKYPHEAWCDPDDVQAALDEIERLRAALLEIIQKDALTGETVFVGDFGKIARAALEGEASDDAAT